MTAISSGTFTLCFSKCSIIPLANNDVPATTASHGMPFAIRIEAANPVIDGKLDDPEWKSANSLPFVRARDKKVKKTKIPDNSKGSLDSERNHFRVPYD